MSISMREMTDTPVPPGESPDAPQALDCQPLMIDEAPLIETAEATSDEPSEREAEAGEAKPVDFEQVFCELESPLVRYALGLVRSLEQAQDIVQEAFLRFHAELSKQGGEFPGKPSSWLYRVAHNLAMDHLRREGRARAHRENTIMEATAPRYSASGAGAKAAVAHQPDLARREGERLAREHLRSLPERDQQVVLLKVEQELSYREIAEIMQLTVGNVGYILHHALKKLAAQLKEEGAV